MDQGSQPGPSRASQRPLRPQRPYIDYQDWAPASPYEEAWLGEGRTGAGHGSSPMASMPYMNMSSSFSQTQATLIATRGGEEYFGSRVMLHQPQDDTLPDQSDTATLAPSVAAPPKTKKTLRFWFIFSALMVVTCLTAVDMTIISTTLPTIIEDLPKSNVPGSWITSSFLLTTTAFQPFMGGLSDVVGRRHALIFAIVLFIGGSIICALADTMLVLVVGRGIQGVGGGGIQAIIEVIISDLTTLRERGIYVGLISLVFALASFIAPVLGGVFSQSNWRWVFWINVPIGVVCLAIIVPAMKLNKPEMPLMAKIHRMDIVANLVLLAGVVGILIAVTDGGIIYAWSSWRIITALVGGCVGLIVFFMLEWIPNPIARDPVLPRRLFGNRTAGVCFIMTFLHGMITYGLIYMLPIYFQSIKGSSPLRSAVQLFPATAPGPVAAILAGVVMAITGRYKIQIIIWWAIIIAGSALLYLFDVDTPTYQWVIYQVLAGFGVGALFTLTLPPIQASLPIEELAHATATFAFCRSFGSVWGIAVGTTTFVGSVNQKLQAIPGLEGLGLTGATALGFATELHKLPIELQEPTRRAFMSSLKWSFLSFVPIAVAGFAISFFVKELPLPDFNESKHGLQDVPAKAEPFPSPSLGSPGYSKGTDTAVERIGMSHLRSRSNANRPPFQPSASFALDMLPPSATNNSSTYGLAM